MPLLDQFQTIIGSIVFGMVLGLFWSIFNRILISKKLFAFRIILEPIFFCFISIIYFIFIAEYAEGIFNIFYLLSLLIGLSIYYFYYAKYFLTWIEEIIKFVNQKIRYPIKLKIKLMHDKFKSKERKNEKNPQ